MLALIPCLDSFSDDEDGSVDKNYFTFCNDDSIGSSSESTETSTGDNNDSIVYSLFTTMV